MSSSGLPADAWGLRARLAELHFRPRREFGLIAECFAMRRGPGGLVPLPLQDPAEGPSLLRALTSPRDAADDEQQMVRDLAGGTRVPLGHGVLLRLREGGQIRVEASSSDPLGLAPRHRLAAGSLRSRLARQGAQLLHGGLAETAPAPGEDGISGPQASALSGALDHHLPGYADWRRRSAEIQVRIPLGPIAQAGARLAAAEQLAALMIALFAHSPRRGPEGPTSPCERARTRLGFVGLRPSFVGFRPDQDPLERWARFALASPATAVHAQDGGLVALPEPLPFECWLRDGSPLGWPRDMDWQTHLRSLRPLVCPEGGILIRAADAQRPEWETVPFHLAHALLVLETPSTWWDPTLAPEAVLDRAVRGGLKDPLIRARSRAVWQQAERALEEHAADPRHAVVLSELQRYRLRYLDRGRTPADDHLARHATPFAAG